MTNQFGSRMTDDANANFTIDAGEASLALVSHIFFYLFLFLVIPSLLAICFLLYFFIRLPEFRQQQYSHHTIIYVLFTAFMINAVDIPLMLPYLQRHYYIISMTYPHVFCAFWVIYDYGMCTSNLWMTALFCIERYLSIFFRQTIMKNKKRRLLLYYGPVTLINVFVFFWFLYLVVLFPCAETSLDFTQLTCGFACYEIEASELLRNFDWILTGLLPVFLTVLFTLILILHVLYQKQKIGRNLARRMAWKRTRKLFLQLLPITVVFVIFMMPVIIVGLLSASDSWYATTPYSYVNPLSYCWPLCIPLVVLSKQTLIRTRLVRSLRMRTVNQIVPIVNTAQPMRRIANRGMQKMTKSTVPIVRVGSTLV